MTIIPVSLWYHSFESKDWTINGYTEVQKITNVEEYWTTFNNVELSIGMFYTMNTKYIPLWDDPKNVNGGAFTNKVDMNRGFEIYKYLSALLFNGKLPSGTVGVSISPKIKNSVVRIWVLSNNKEGFVKSDLFDIADYGFKSNKEA